MLKDRMLFLETLNHPSANKRFIIKHGCLKLLNAQQVKKET